MKKHTLIFGLAIAVILAGLSLKTLTTRADTTNSTNPYDSENLSVSDIVDKYHEDMNEAFNRYIKMMLAEQAKNPNDVNGKPLANSQACLDPANAKNYSTYCVAVNLLERYDNFRTALEGKRNLIFETEQQKSGTQKSAEKALSSAAELTLIPTIDRVISRNITTDEQINIAKKTLDQTLSAYDQLRLAWPLHQKYVQIYKDLETFRDNLVKVRQQTDVYPAKFVDVTTSKCT